MSSSSTTDGESKQGAVPGKKNKHSPARNGEAAEGGAGAEASGPSLPASPPEAQPRRPSGIPLPAGFRHRPAQPSEPQPSEPQPSEPQPSEPQPSDRARASDPQSSDPARAGEPARAGDIEAGAATEAGSVAGTAPASARPLPPSQRALGRGAPSAPPRPRRSDGAPAARASGLPRPPPRPRSDAPAPSSAAQPASTAREAKALPRLMLAPLAPAELLYERLQEPSSESPILYRERAYLVDALQTDDDLEDHLEAELSRIRRDWRHRDASQFVHLSLFDCRFDGEPSAPPIATLSWKDWQGRSEIWVRGVRRSTLPPVIPRTAPPAAHEAQAEPELPSSPGSGDASWLEPDAVLEPGERDDAEELELVELPAEAEPERAPDSGPGWQSPDRSGEYLIPLPDDALAPPSSQRVPAGDELLDALFERMHQLSGALTVGAAADFVLGVLGEHIACDGVLISGLDAAREELVVLRASGPKGRELVGRRAPLAAWARSEALHQGVLLELGPAELARSPGLWPALELLPAHALTAPVTNGGRLLGVIELCRSAEREPFNSAHGHALELVCEQLAELIADRPLELALAPPVPAP